MTTENTENTNPKAKDKSKDKDKDKAKSKPSDPSGSAAPAEKATNPLGFEYEFLPLPAEVAETNSIRINPKDIAISKVDARSAPALVDPEFVASIRKDGLIQDPCVTYARNRKTGKEVWLIVAGRRRREGSIQAELKEITCKALEIKGGLKEYLILAGQENLKRDQMTFWDKFCFLQNLMASGSKQSELKDQLSVSEGNISQVLAIGKLDERVQKMVREGGKEPFKSYAPSVVRELKRVTDPEMQVAFAQQAIDEGLEPKALKFMIERWLQKQAATEDKSKSAAKTGGRGLKLPDVVEAKAMKPINKTDLAAFYNFSNARFAKLKASDKAKPETIAYEKGRRDGLAQAAGLADLPALPEGEEE